MNQALLSIENEAMTRSDSDFEAPMISSGQSFQAPDWGVESHPVTSEKLRIKGTPALLFFWDGKKVHRIRDERLKDEIAGMVDYSL